MSAPLMIVLASFLFATMGVCVKLATTEYATGEIVFYRSVVSALCMVAWARWQRGTLRTEVPAMHLWRCLAGVAGLCLWFYSLGGLPLATAMTLNYMSSVWMALFLVGGAIALGSARIDGRLVATVLTGFAGVALVLRPTIAEQQLWHGLMGLLSGILGAMAYLQVTALGRVGEPEYRVVFYFSICGMGAGLVLVPFTGLHAHSPRGLLLLLAVGVLATVAQWLMTRAYTTGRLLVNASLQYLGIVFSFAYGVVLFGDRLSPLAIFGMALIVGAGLLAALVRSRTLSPDVARTPAES